MPITTRTIAKGIPPRLHQSKPSQNVKKGKCNTSATIKRGCKRVSRSNSDEEESEPELIRKKVAKSHHLEEQEQSEEEGMVSEHAIEPPELVDDVDNRTATPPSDEQDVRM